MDDEGQLEECDGCHYLGLLLKTYESSKISGLGPKSLCELCAETLIGNSVEYPNQYEYREVMQLIGFCTNKILQKLEQIEKRLP